MNNKIDHIVSASPALRSSTGDASAAAPKGSSTPVGAPDSVRITADASQLAAVDRALASAQDVDVEKVNAVRDALSGGRYNIDSGVIADKMLQFEQLLGTRR